MLDPKPQTSLSLVAAPEVARLAALPAGLVYTSAPWCLVHYRGLVRAGVLVYGGELEP